MTAAAPHPLFYRVALAALLGGLSLAAILLGLPAELVLAVAVIAYVIGWALLQRLLP
jgi:hypothetical protein